MRRITAVLLILTTIFLLPGCDKEEADSFIATEKPLEEKAETTKDNLKEELQQVKEQTEEETIRDSWEEKLKNTYWTGYELKDAFGAEKLPADNKWMDLILREDGTAQFREVQNELILQNDLMLDMSWRVEGNQIGLYTDGFSDPYVSGFIENDEIVLEYYGSNLLLQQQEMPVETGELLSPAQLSGTWILTSGMVEGWEWDAREEWQYGLLNFTSVWNEEKAELTLVANYEQRNLPGEMRDAFYDRELTVLHRPVYSGCGNEKWSVYLGSRMAYDSEEILEEMEYYVTLTDENTMLLQTFFTIDGGPAVSYGYYKRILPTASVWEITAEELESTVWKVIGFTDGEGEVQPIKPEMEDFIIFLDEDGICYLSRSEEETGEEITSEGEWILGKGGGILLWEEEYGEVWLSGAVMMNNVETEEESSYRYEMYLYYEGGILQLSPVQNSAS